MQKGILVVLAYWPLSNHLNNGVKEGYLQAILKGTVLTVSPWSHDHGSGNWHLVHIYNSHSIPWSHSCHLWPSQSISDKQINGKAKQKLQSSDIALNYLWQFINNHSQNWYIKSGTVTWLFSLQLMLSDCCGSQLQSVSEDYLCWINGNTYCHIVKTNILQTWFNNLLKITHNYNAAKPQ